MLKNSIFTVYNFIMPLKKKIFCLAATLIFSFCFAEENEFFVEEEIPAAELSSELNKKEFFLPELLKPEKTNETPKKNSVTIKTNTRNAKVFLNGIYKGVTPISIDNLEPGTYRLRLEKTGFLPVERFISVSKGTTFSYYYEMTEIKGFVDIRGIPNVEKSLIFADGNKIYAPFFELSEGFHTIQVKSFGYEDFSASIFVKRRHIKRISLKMKKAEFRITDFYSSRKTINPKYGGSIGNCLLTAKVSAPGTGRISIKNTDGEEIFYAELPEFSTWEQNLTWNGKDSSGNDVPSGKYIAVFSAEEQSALLEVNVDRTLVFPLADLTAGGTGIGFVTTASAFPKSTKMLNFSVAPISSSKEGFYATPISLGFADSIFEQLEFSMKFSIFAGIEDTPFEISFAAKFADKTKNENSPVQFRYGASAHYGVCDKKLFPEYGADFGSGLGLAGFLGLCNAEFSADFSSEFIFGVKSSNPFNGDNSWKNGLALSFSPLPEFSANISCALISNSNFFDAIQPKAGFSYLIPGTSFVFNADFYGIIYFDSPYYLGGSAGFGYLF